MDWNTIFSILLFSSCVLFAIMVFSGTLVWYTFSPSMRLQRALKKQAKEDFQNARGTAHLKMLRQARSQLKGKVSDWERNIANYQSNLQNLEARRDSQLRKALEHHIAFNHLTDIPGIGPKLRNTLLNQVYKNKVRDLRYASSIPGIGDAKQRDINYWINKYEQRIPQLMKQDFKGKSEINRRFEPDMIQIKKNISKLRGYQQVLNKKVSKADEEIKKLEDISLADFILAVQSPDSAEPAIEHYLEGAFAEWEPMPKWFKDLISEGGR